MDINSSTLAPAADTETVKMEHDFSEECNVKIPESEKLAREGNLTKAIDELVALEKQTRTVSIIN